MPDSWVAVKELYRGLSRVYYPPIMENQMEQMENEMETGGI